MAARHSNEFGDVFRFERTSGNTPSMNYVVTLLESIRQFLADQRRTLVNPHNFTVRTTASANAHPELMADAASG